MIWGPNVHFLSHKYTVLAILIYFLLPYFCSLKFGLLGGQARAPREILLSNNLQGLSYFDTCYDNTDFFSILPRLDR